ncbi:hypothetical protein T265_11058 [Opisthorchis viverrini]|uniref:Uncharacterized protein n=1 Tax=Opisthorchis viverrini TaxID=6198 RepID=A0A074Z4D7_OPIVI|nr:hypothetical protein T265_11058 [Opisthorchis viverrini]KER20387.1 hypothetical protein T265_11058 [Opisthorchis viverrini]
MNLTDTYMAKEDKFPVGMKIFVIDDALLSHFVPDVFQLLRRQQIAILRLSSSQATKSGAIPSALRSSSCFRGRLIRFHSSKASHIVIFDFVMRLTTTRLKAIKTAF